MISPPSFPQQRPETAVWFDACLINKESYSVFWFPKKGMPFLVGPILFIMFSSIACNIVYPLKSAFPSEMTLLTRFGSMLMRFICQAMHVFWAKIKKRAAEVQKEKMKSCLAHYIIMY